MCKALPLFKTPFYTHVLIKMRFYRCIYRGSVMKHKFFPSQKNVFWFCWFYLQKNRRLALHRDCSVASAPWNNSTIPSRQHLGISVASNEISKYHGQNKKCCRSQGNTLKHIKHWILCPQRFLVLKAHTVLLGTHVAFTTSEPRHCW